MRKYVGYIRESTLRWLTLGEQREEIARHLTTFEGRLVAEYIVDVRRLTEGEQIFAALRDCKKHKARLLIPFIERIDRAGVLLAALVDSKVRFEVIRAESKANRRVIEALNRAAEAHQDLLTARRKTRPKKPATNPGGLRRDGTPALTQEARAKGTVMGLQTRKDAADAFVARMRPRIQALVVEGFTHYAIAGILNEEKLRTAGGKVGKWDATKVRRVLIRPERPLFETPSGEEDKRWKTLRREEMYQRDRARDEALGPASTPIGEGVQARRKNLADDWVEWIVAGRPLKTAEGIMNRKTGNGSGPESRAEQRSREKGIRQRQEEVDNLPWPEWNATYDRLNAEACVFR